MRFIQKRNRMNYGGLVLFYIDGKVKTSEVAVSILRVMIVLNQYYDNLRACFKNDNKKRPSYSK
jgi:hypothetical protein